MSAPPTEPFFPGLIFNISFFTAGDEPVTLNYVNNNFLKCVGYAYSRAIATTFNGGIFALGGISTSDITATGTITAAFFTGSGANLTNLNASNITDGTLTVSRGGTGLNTIPLGSLLIGNGANTLLQTTNLSWDNTNSILNATNFSGSHSGSGAGLINLNVSNANAGTLPIGRGGTGATSFIGGRLLYGDGVNPLAQSANLTWNNTNNTLNTTNVNSSAYFINGSPFTPYTLPTANAATLGGIKVGNNLSIDGNGVLSATSSGLTGADIFLDGGVNNRAYGWTGATSLLGRAGTAGAYSLNSLAEDVILRSQGRILLQSGTNVPGVTIETTTNNVIIRNSLGIGITTFGAGDILDVGGVFKVAYNGVAESLTIRSTGINVNNTLNVSSGTNNGGIIRFGGFSDDTSLDLATIQNRQYATNKSELLLFKGDNIEGLTGADRIRLRAGAIAFDTFSTDVTTSATTENIRMYIDNSGNVGIGTTTPLSNYLLDVRGNIITTGNIALVNASRSIFWTGTNSNLARAGIAGEYSTSAAINDIVLRSGNNLILQSGTGASCMFIDTANNVGIGTTSITTGVKLDVNGLIESRTGIGANSSFYFRGVANSDINRVISAGQFSNGSAVNDTVIRSTNKLVLQSGATAPAIIINTSNNVGIGITNPLQLLDVSGNLLVRSYGTTGSGTRGIFFRSDHMGASLQYNCSILTFDHGGGGPTDGLSINGYGGVSICTGANTRVERMRIAINGAVGIQNAGYAIPNNYMAAGSLTIGNNTANYGGGSSWNANTAGLLMECLDNTEIAVHDAGAAIHSFMYYSGGVFTMGRNMGWGVGRLSVVGSISSSANIDSGSYIISTAGQLYARSTFDALLYTDSGQMSLNMGNIGSGSSPTYLKFGAYSSATYLESSNNRAIIFNNWSGTLSGTRYQWIFNTNATSYNALNSSSWNVLSDQRIKENIIKADLKTCYDNIKNINLYRYNYINEFDSSSEDKNKLGYIAQEVKKHFPKGVIKKKHRLIDNREIPDLLTIDVDQINLTLYGAVKQLIKVVEKQNKRIKTLETLLNIEDNDDVENDAGQPFERIYDENEIDIDTIEPTEPSNEV